MIKKQKGGVEEKNIDIINKINTFSVPRWRDPPFCRIHLQKPDQIGEMSQ